MVNILFLPKYIHTKLNIIVQLIVSLLFFLGPLISDFSSGVNRLYDVLEIGTLEPRKCFERTFEVTVLGLANTFRNDHISHQGILSPYGLSEKVTKGFSAI